MVDETPLKRTDHGLVPEAEGWFVVNARDARWLDDGALGVYTPFAGDARFPKVGINLAVLEPGQPGSMYHREDEQEDFLVLAGKCLLLIEEQERELRAWDFVHCPAWTDHVFVGAGDGPCAILMIGSRTPDAGVVYPESDLARRHGAGVEQETDSADEAYRPYPKRRVPIAYPHDWLPDR
ncbi:MAG: cupin domain-containing protein [Actinomycetota bacterium]